MKVRSKKYTKDRGSDLIFGDLPSPRYRRRETGVPDRILKHVGSESHVKKKEYLLTSRHPSGRLRGSDLCCSQVQTRISLNCRVPLSTVHPFNPSRTLPLRLDLGILGVLRTVREDGDIYFGPHPPHSPGVYGYPVCSVPFLSFPLN